MRTLFLAALLAASSVHAALMEGHTVTLEHLYPVEGRVDETIAANVTVGSGIEGKTFDDAYQIDVCDEFIRIKQLRDITWTQSSFNGLHIQDAAGMIASFSTVFTVFSESDFQLWNFDSAQTRLTWDDDNIWINWEGMSVLNGQALVLELNAPVTSAPEPSTWGLMALGLTALIPAWGRKARRL
jgi:hypothetical protein